MMTKRNADLYREADADLYDTSSEHTEYMEHQSSPVRSHCHIHILLVHCTRSNRFGTTLQLSVGLQGILLCP